MSHRNRFALETTRDKTVFLISGGAAVADLCDELAERSRKLVVIVNQRNRRHYPGSATPLVGAPAW